MRDCTDVEVRIGVLVVVFFSSVPGLRATDKILHNEKNDWWPRYCYFYWDMWFKWDIFLYLERDSVDLYWLRTLLPKFGSRLKGEIKGKVFISGQFQGGVKPRYEQLWHFPESVSMRPLPVYCSIYVTYSMSSSSSSVFLIQLLSFRRELEVLAASTQ